MKSSVFSAGKPGTKAKNPSTQTNGGRGNGNAPSDGDASTSGETSAWNEPNHEQIANLACQLYIESGCQEGRDAENWLRAEQILRQGKRQGTPATHGHGASRKPAGENEPRSRQQF